ncbi:MAG TPA: DUF2513 domain-containing protein [Verrucomicrobiae bacterium]|nr:DUF2513 domain-containing protein [Verrucomicrobiae bacterium]
MHTDYAKSAGQFRHQGQPPSRCRRGFLKSQDSRWLAAQRVYHSALLIEAELVHGETVLDGSGQPVGTVILRPTWAGHEFLDAARNDTIWHKAGERIKKSGVDVTLSLLKEILNQLLKQSLNLP